MKTNVVWQCQLCDKNLSSKRTVLSHIFKIHDGEDGENPVRYLRILVSPKDIKLFDKSNNDMKNIDRSSSEASNTEVSNSGKLNSDKPNCDTTHSDKPLSDKPLSDKPNIDNPLGDKPHTDKPHNDKAHTDKPHSDKPHSEYPHESPSVKSNSDKKLEKTNQPNVKDLTIKQSENKNSNGDKKKKKSKEQKNKVTCYDFKKLSNKFSTPDFVEDIPSQQISRKTEVVQANNDSLKLPHEATTGDPSPPTPPTPPLPSSPHPTSSPSDPDQYPSVSHQPSPVYYQYQNVTTQPLPASSEFYPDVYTCSQPSPVYIQYQYVSDMATSTVPGHSHPVSYHQPLKRSTFREPRM